MPNFRSWMLISTVLFLVSCQGDTRAKQSIVEQVPDVLEIDLEKKVARSTFWEKPVIDCSDDSQNCLIIDGIFSASFPKKCADFRALNKWISPIGNIRSVAIQPHFGAPFGSYISENYPNSLLLYRGGVGLEEVRITNSTPFQDDFDPNQFSKSYKIVLNGTVGAFLCSD